MQISNRSFNSNMREQTSTSNRGKWSTLIKIEHSWVRWLMQVQLIGKAQRNCQRYHSRHQVRERHIWVTWLMILELKKMIKWCLTVIITHKYLTINKFGKIAEDKLAVTITNDPLPWLTSRCRVRIVLIVWTTPRCSNGIKEIKWITMAKSLMVKIRCSKNSYSRAPCPIR